MSINPNVLSGPCVGGCGRTVERDNSTAGRYAKFLAGIPLMCTDCGVRKDRERAEAERDEQLKREAELLPRRIAESGLPVTHQERQIADLDDAPELLAAAAAWATGQLPGLLFTGDVGRGKTTLAGAAALEMLQCGRSLVWASAPLVMARLGSGFNTDQHAWAIDTLSGNKGLVLDDIDKARPTEYGAEHIFLAIDTRVEHRLPLLVTSNLDLGQIAARWPSPYGDAIASRLVGYCRVLRVDGRDRRLRSVS